MGYLLLDLVGAAEHVVDLGEVVGAGQDAVGLTLGGVVLLEVGLLAEIAELQWRQSRVFNNSKGSKGKLT